MESKKLSKIARDLADKVLDELCRNPEISGSALCQEYVLAETTKLLSQELSMWLWADLPENRD